VRVLATRRLPGEAWNELCDVEIGTPDRPRDDVEVLIVANETVDEAVLDLLPSLRLVANFGVGYDRIDVAGCRARGIPVAFMTYLNPILAEGTERFLRLAAAASASGVIVPDLPVDEAGEWLSACADASVAAVLLAAPNSSADRLRVIAERSDGFVYCVSTMGVTGSREALSGSARGVVDALRPLTRTPLLAGVGVSTPEQAAKACGFADGVVVGSALVAPMLDGDTAGMLESARAFGAAVAAAGAGQA
jgi:tryptophan synthase alpha chain